MVSALRPGLSLVTAGSGAMTITIEAVAVRRDRNHPDEAALITLGHPGLG